MKLSWNNRGTKRGALERRVLTMCLLMMLAGGWIIFKMPAQLAAMEEQRKYNAELNQFSELFAEIYYQIENRYVDEVEPKKLLEGAINGMMMSLDPHSSWMPPAIQEQLTRDTEGEYSGVGLVITLRDRILTVISPVPGSPAGKLGVMPWDRIIEIDGETTENMALPEAVKRLTGPTGSQVTIKVWREGETKPLEFKITRETVHIESVFSKIIDDGRVGYVRLARFQEDTADQLAKVLERFNREKVKGVVVDLRNNPGGLLDEAVDVVNLFVPKGQLIVSMNGRNAPDNRKYYAKNDPISRQPLVVLVNQGSASASEIFAGAMKDTRRGVIIGPEGQKTFGKGSVQTISPLQYSLERDERGDIKQSGLRLTTARYYTPSGESIHEKGIEPDIGVKLPEGHERDMMLRGALLGEPSTLEPGSADPDASTTVPPRGVIEEMETTGTLLQRLNNRVTTGTQTTAPAEAPDAEPFHDILLDEAIKILKAMLIIDENKVASS